MYVVYKKYTLNMKTNRLKGWRSIFKANTTLNKASNYINLKADFRTSGIIRGKEGYYIMTNLV